MTPSSFISTTIRTWKIIWKCYFQILLSFHQASPVKVPCFLIRLLLLGAAEKCSLARRKALRHLSARASLVALSCTLSATPTPTLPLPAFTPDDDDEAAPAAAAVAAVNLRDLEPDISQFSPLEGPGRGPKTGDSKSKSS